LFLFIVPKADEVSGKRNFMICSHQLPLNQGWMGWWGKPEMNTESWLRKLLGIQED
jgi:hypothetical protein